MTHKFTRTISIGAAVLALTACSTPDTESQAQDHVERLSEAYEAKQVREDKATREGQTAQTQPGPSPSFPGDAPTFDSEWAKEQLEDYMIYQGANSLEGFIKTSPERHITAVDSPEDGVVRFTVADRDYEADGWHLEGTAVNFMSWVGCAADDVDAVIVEKEGGGESVSQDGCY